jgi:tetratricopeptide (TPR) repeat protein
MALQTKKNRKGKSNRQRPEQLVEQEVELGELQRLTRHIQDNPVVYAAAAVFIIVVVVAGSVFKKNATLTDQRYMTQYAEALTADDPAAQADKLSVLTDNQNRWTAEAVYVLGETSIRAQEYGKAKEAFTRVGEEFADTDYAAPAADGLAFLAENEGDLKTALAGYQNVLSQWPNSLVGRRESFNIGRVQEELGDFEAAVKAYEEQISSFPDSVVAAKSEQALARLRTEHSELFSAEPEPPALETVLVGGEEQ